MRRLAMCRGLPFGTRVCARDGAGLDHRRPRCLSRGLELVDLTRYSYWGDRLRGRRAVFPGLSAPVQLLRPASVLETLAAPRPAEIRAELAWLHRTYGVEVIDFADENPTASRPAWQAFLECIIAENVPLTLIGSTRADDIVRDADLLPLYKKAGVARFLLGIESYVTRPCTRFAKAPPPPTTVKPSASCAAWHPLDGDLCRRVRGRDRSRLPAQPAATALLRSGSDPVAVRHATPLDALLP